MSEEKNEPDEKKPFAGLRPGRMSAAGKVKPHERRVLMLLAPIAIAMVVLLLTPKPGWWPAWLTLVDALVLIAGAVWVLARGLKTR